MRKVLIGLVAAFGVCGICLGQEPVTQQNQQPQAGQLRAGQQPGQQSQVTQPGQNQFNQQGLNQQGQALQPGQPGQPGQPVGPAGQFAPRPQYGQPGQAVNSDQEIAACVCGAARNEIEIAKLAQTKAKSEDVRQFAEKMVRDHTPGCEEMQRLAGPLASSTTQQRGGEGQGGRLDWVSIHKQIGDQCLASLKEEFSKKSGGEFDECFMGQQIGEHFMVIEKLKVLRNYASNDLRQKLDKELETAQQHLQLAKQIEHKLQGESERLSRRQTDSNK